MTYDALLQAISKELPQLEGKLRTPQVVFHRAQNKTYITFESTVLVEEASFLRLEALLRRLFPGRPLALRVVSPALAEDFKQHVGKYRQVLVDFLKFSQKTKNMFYPLLASLLIIEHKVTKFFKRIISSSLSLSLRNFLSLCLCVQLSIKILCNGAQLYG
jgi:hypothetical protein